MQTTSKTSAPLNKSVQVAAPKVHIEIVLRLCQNRGCKVCIDQPTFGNSAASLVQKDQRLMTFS